MSAIARNRPLGLAARTRKNLAYVIMAAEQGADLHPVTELTNSLLAIIVFPWEKRIGDHALAVRLELLPPEWPKWHMKYDQPKTLRDLLERLRNAIGHANVTFSSDSRVLHDVRVTLTDRGKSGKDLKWEGTISAEDLRRFCFAFIDLLEASGDFPAQPSN